MNDKVIPFKSLLSHSLLGKNGESTSKAYVKDIILKLISKEDKTRPISDASITAELQNDGIDIKRRTVAKYRESLNMLPSHLRKRVKV